MKTVYITTMMVLAVCMLLFPLMAAAPNVQGESSQVLSENVLQNNTEISTVKVKLSKSGEIKEFSLEDYIFGVVAAEMPALYENEALKAQAVAAYTYFLKKTQSNTDKEYDITDDFTVDQAFIMPEDAREKWASGADEYENKIRSAVKSVLYKKITCSGEIISAVYHAVSGGKTENASDVWGGEYSYLVSVDSSWDKLSDNYLSSASFTAEELKAKLSSVAEIGDISANCFSNITRTAAGSISKISVSGKEVSGSSVRLALGLKSSDFDVAFSDGKYTFTVRGYGHGIGMSQHGANYLAMQGKTYEEILRHYYTGCAIE